MSEPILNGKDVSILDPRGKGKLLKASVNERRNYLACVFGYPDDDYQLVLYELASNEWAYVCQHWSIVPTVICWSSFDVVAVGSACGEVQIMYRSVRKEETAWKTNPSVFVQPGEEIVDMAFVHRLSGMKLAVAFRERQVLVLEPDQPFQPDRWAVRDSLRIPTGLEVLCLAWRTSLPGEPDAICVGTGCGVMVFGSKGRKEWFLACEELRCEISICSISWAPSNGRSFDLIATATGNRILIWRLCAGRLGALSLDLDTDFTMGSDVTRVEFSPSGLKIAALCGKNDIWILEQRANGSWDCNELMAA